MVSLDHERVWMNVHVPEITQLKDEIISEASTLFNKIGKVDVKPLLTRIKKHDSIQMAIDELALEMLELDNWKPRLDDIYDAVTLELEAMHKILETSKTPSKSKNKLKPEEKRETDLSKWFG
jgi:hypothetical protein